MAIQNILDRLCPDQLTRILGLRNRRENTSYQNIDIARRRGEPTRGRGG